MWFEVNTIQLFVAFMQHDTHNRSIQIVDSSYVLSPNSEFILHEETKSVVSLLYKGGHYGVAEFVLKTRKLNVYDGMFPPISHWRSVTGPLENIIQTALSKRKSYVVRYHKNGNVKPPKKFSSLLCLRKWGHAIEQTDDVNCGPIAAVILWGLIVEFDNVRFEEFLKIFKRHTLGYRDAIVKALRLLFLKHPDHWLVEKNCVIMDENMEDVDRDEVISCRDIICCSCVAYIVSRC